MKRCVDCKNYFEDRSVGETNCESFDISENDFQKYFFEENDITNCPYFEKYVRPKREKKTSLLNTVYGEDNEF